MYVQMIRTKNNMYHKKLNDKLIYCIHYCVSHLPKISRKMGNLETEINFFFLAINFNQMSLFSVDSIFYNNIE